MCAVPRPAVSSFKTFNCLVWDLWSCVTSNSFWRKGNIRDHKWWKHFLKEKSNGPLSLKLYSLPLILEDRPMMKAGPKRDFFPSIKLWAADFDFLPQQWPGHHPKRQVQGIWVASTAPSPGSQRTKRALSNSDHKRTSFKRQGLKSGV